MRPRLVAAVVLCVAAFAAARPSAAQDAAPAAPDARSLVAKLDAEDAATRDAAERGLAELGEDARPVLEERRAAAGAEARRRIAALLQRLDDRRRAAEARTWAGLRGGPQRAGVVGGAIPRELPKLVWQADVPDGAPLQGALAATDESVVTLSADGTVRCFAAEDGSRRWLSVLDAQITASAAFDTSRVIVPTAKGVEALDARDGHVVWRVESAYGCRAAPAISGSNVFVSLRNDSVSGFDLATGEKRFERRMAPQGALLAADDLLVTGTEEGTFHSLDPQTGRDRWKTDLGGAPVMGPTLAAPGVLVVFTKDRVLRGIRASDGKTLWTARQFTLSASESIPAAAGRVFLTDTSGFVRAFDAATGAELWNRNEGFLEMGAPAATGDAVCFGSRGRLGCRDAATGDFLWRLDAERRDCSSPIVAAGRILVLDAGRLRCLR